MPFIGVKYDRQQQKEILDALAPSKDTLLMFANGTIKEVADMFGKGCSTCKTKLEEDVHSDVNMNYLIYGLRKFEDAANLICTISSVARAVFENSPTLIGLINDKFSILCNRCSSNASRTVPPPRVPKRPLEDVKNFPLQFKSEPSESEGTTYNSPELHSKTKVSLENSTPHLPSVVDSTFLNSTNPSEEYNSRNSGSRSLPKSAKRARTSTESLQKNTTPLNKRTPKTTKAKKDEDTSFDTTPQWTSSGRIVKTTLKKKETEEFKDDDNGRHVEAVCMKCDKTLRSLNKHGYKSAMMTNLTGHVRTHSTSYPFKCNVCDHKCRFESAMKKHQELHGDDKTRFTSYIDAAEYKEEMAALMEECFPDWV